VLDNNIIVFYIITKIPIYAILHVRVETGKYIKHTDNSLMNLIGSTRNLDGLL